VYAFENQKRKVLSSGAINSLRDVERMRAVLRNKPRDLLLFDLATRTGAPIKHLLQLRVKDLQKLEIGDRFAIGSKTRNVPYYGFMNKVIHVTLQKYVDETGVLGEDYLFRSRKGSEALSLSSVSRMIKGWFKTAGLSESGAAHSLRKTWQVHFKTGSPDLLSDRGEQIGDSVLRPVQVKTTQQVVFEELERAIVSGRIPPGEPLVIEEVTKQMGVSRIPVREAFGRLEAKGFITTLPKRGSIVNELSVENLKEIIEVRLVNESIAARRAALNRSEEVIAQLEDLHEKWIAACNDDDVDELLRVNREFHHTLYRCANMPILQTLIEYLWDRMSPYLHILLRQRDIRDPLTDIRLHERILKALKRGDPKGVVKWVRTDLKDGARITVELFEIYRKSQKEASSSPVSPSTGSRGE